MSDFTSVTGETRRDPSKRVRYSHGLVLGVDELEQEQYYFLEQNRLHARRLHGYGRICGLAVSIDGGKVTVSKGLALSPKGALIRVPEDQCGDLDQWLERHGGSPATPVYLILCHLECESDNKPVPGAPCRSEDESIAPSRITESFELRFSSDPPDQTEHAAVSRLGDLLARFFVTDDAASPGLSEAELPELLQEVVDDTAGEGPIPVQITALEGLLERLMSLWTSVYQPKLLEKDAACSGQPPEEDCVLLAVITEDDAAYALDDAESPYLLSTRLLQELLLRMPGLAAPDEILSAVDGDLRGNLPNPEVDGIIGIPIDDRVPPSPGEVLVYRAPVISQTSGAAFDPQGPHWAVRRLRLEDLGDVRITGPSQADLLLFDAGSGRWRDGGLALTQLTDVALSNPPSSGDTLTWTGTQWDARPPADPPPPPRVRTLPFADIYFIAIGEGERGGFDVWFHLDVLPNAVAVRRSENERAIEIFAETSAQPFVAPIPQTALPQQRFRNLFFLAPDMGRLRELLSERGFLLLRFVFLLADIPIEDPGGSTNLKDYTDRSGITFDGHDPDTGTVTRFLRLDDIGQSRINDAGGGGQ